MRSPCLWCAYWSLWTSRGAWDGAARREPGWPPRLKAGTAQKLVLNTLSTLVMVRLGRTYGNRMVDLHASNTKLRDRAHRIVRLATDATSERANDALDGTGGETKLAILMILTELPIEDARRLMVRSGGTCASRSPRRSPRDRHGARRTPGPGGGHRPGTWMAAEIAEQPSAWQRLLDNRDAAGIGAAAEAIRAVAPHTVLLLGRGTSAHAALYAKYLVEIVHQRPAGLMSPSTVTTYGARPDLRGVLVIAVSQSGGSPDLVHTLQVARAGGAHTVAITNAPGSALAQAAHAHVDVLAGRERAVTVGRGYGYATAREAALKLMETSYISAQAFSGADLLHGPLALIDPDAPRGLHKITETL